MVTLRDYAADRDSARLRDCLIELQNSERELEPGKPEGSTIADEYLDRMFARCRKWDGKVFVAEVAGQAVGFVCVWAKVPPEEPNDDPSEYAFVSDLVVLPGHRRRGVGRELLAMAERYARSRGARSLRIGVLARNATARHLYGSAGFSDYEVEMEKPLV
jgi:ribosomal protein S18 acetylase RimI-like enzyme